MATKISNILVKAIVFFAVIGIIFLLTMYNAKLLNTLNWFKMSNTFYDKLVIIISSISYSLGSIAVVIWYNPTKSKTDTNAIFTIKYIAATFLKLVFVIIDGIHVYVYNNTHIEDLAKWLSPVYALQTSLILFFVGAIVNDIIKNGKQKEELEKSKFTELNSKIELKESKINSLHTKIENLNTNITNYQSDIGDKQTVISELQTDCVAYTNETTKYLSQIQEQETKIAELQTYYKSYLKSEAARIRKKKVENRTEEEVLVLVEAENVIEN